VIEFAGVTLALRTPELDDWLRRNRLSALDLFGRPPTEATLRTVAKGHADPRVPFPRPNYSPDPEPQINVLHWPTGASRFGWFVGIASDAAWRKVLESFETETSPAGVLLQIKPKPLIVGDSDYQDDLKDKEDGWHADNKKPNHFAIKTQMYLLDPRPISLRRKETLWLLPMVDCRYWWRTRILPHRLPTDLVERVPEPELKTTWSGWKTVFQHAVSPAVTGSDPEVELIAIPELDSDHENLWFFPDRTELDRPLEPVGPLMDAWAHSMGRRVVRHFNGRVEIVDVGTSQDRHDDNTNGIESIVAGGPHLMTKTVSELNDMEYHTGLYRPPFVAHQTLPKYVDVSFRQLVEFSDDNLPDDVPDAFSDNLPPESFPLTHIFYGVGVRTIRHNLVDDLTGVDHNPTIVFSQQARQIRCASWVGRVFWSEERDEDTNELIEPPGAIDVEFCGDRYFRLAQTISSDYVAWTQQRHEYVMAKFRRWTPSGFDDFIDVDHDAGLVHVRSHRGDFGIDSFLVQVHQQTEFAPDQVVGVITSEWTLYPKELEQPRDPDVEGDLDCLLLTAEESIGTARELPVTIDDLTTDRFDATWQWAEAEVRPFIPADPHAVRGSLDYGRTMVWAHETAIVGVTRSQKIIEALRDRLDCVTVVAADAPDDRPTLIGDDRPDCFDWDRTDVLTSASGVAYLRRYGNEWQFIEIDCD
jgi:hypothetical protein